MKKMSFSLSGDQVKGLLLDQGREYQLDLVSQIINELNLEDLYQINDMVTDAIMDLEYEAEDDDGWYDPWDDDDDDENNEDCPLCHDGVCSISGEPCEHEERGEGVQIPPDGFMGLLGILEELKKMAGDTITEVQRGDGLEVGDVVKVKELDPIDHGNYKVGEVFIIRRIDLFRDKFFYSKGDKIPGLRGDQLDGSGL